MSLFSFYLFISLCLLITFLYSIKEFTTNLNFALNSTICNFISKSTNSTFKCFLLGIVLTAITGSSTAITVITLSFIASKQISKINGLIVVISSNIGTSFSTMFFSINSYLIILLILIVGFIICFSKYKNLGKIIVLLGILLFSLKHMCYNLEKLIETSNLSYLILKFNNNYIYMFFFGIVISFLIQSSNAGIGIIQQLSLSNYISIKCGIAFMLGANIGTTILGIIISCINDKNSFHVSLINFTFNFLGSIIFMLLINSFTSLLLIIQENTSANNALVISLSHIIYNTITVFLFFIIFYIYIKKRKHN